MCVDMAADNDTCACVLPHDDVHMHCMAHMYAYSLLVKHPFKGHKLIA